jgi:dUTPase
VALTNISDEPYKNEPGERIAQLVIMPVCVADIVCCDELGGTQEVKGIRLDGEIYALYNNH